VVSRGLVADVALVLGAAGLTGLAAQVAFPIPGTPVPVTLQTFAVLLAGAALGWQRALASMALYVAAGLAGVPWFAGHSSGLPKATFGYLLGFILAAVLVGRLAGRGGDRTPLRTIGTMTLGTLVVYLVGVPVLDANVPGGLAEALELGAVPFLLGDAVKVLAAAGVLPGAWWLVRRMKGDAAA
jgi:biotin transport system substrate-specific component